MLVTSLYQVVVKRTKRADFPIESAFTKAKLFIEIIMEEVETVVLKETEFEQKDESNEYAIFDKFRLSYFRCMDR